MRLDGCPEGRIITGKAGRSEPLKNVIWWGRNQSMHFEEADYKKALIACFLNLGFDLTADTYKQRNLAKEIVLHVLKWTTYEMYEADLRCLLVDA